jgi:transaldolase / glucose-6-phosphate isomerase
MSVATQQDLVERIWARDPTLWTGEDEDKWLGWLDEPKRMQERIDDLQEFVEEVAVAGVLDTFVLLGMGGSSLAPIVLKKSFDAGSLHVLDTTHPAMLRHALRTLDLERTLFIASSKSGTTLETRSHLDFFWEQAERRGEQFAVITDPGSDLERLAEERGFRRVFYGEPTIGGRYSALSPFGLVPAALIGIDLERLLERAAEMVEACRFAEGNPGLELGLQLGEGWREGRDKVCIDETPGGFGLWAEQLIAESTGKQGKGLVPAPGESPKGPDRQRGEVRLEDAYELAQEFFRWEFAVAVAGAILGVNVFNQPDVQAAKDKTKEVLSSGEDPKLEPQGSLDDLFADAKPPHYIAIQAFIDPTREGELAPLIARAHETGCVVTHGLGPRYLHSTGQLQKGGPPTGLFVQVVDDTGDEIPIPDQDFGFGRLIRAQAEGDFRSLKERGRTIVRTRLEDL